MTADDAGRRSYHRRTLDETCEVCHAGPGKRCIDQRGTNTAAVATKNLHRYRPVED